MTDDGRIIHLTEGGFTKKFRPPAPQGSGGKQAMTTEQRDFRARFFDVIDADEGFEVPPVMSIRPTKEELAAARAARRAQEEGDAAARMLGIALVLCGLVGVAVILWGVSQW